MTSVLFVQEYAHSFLSIQTNNSCAVFLFTVANMLNFYIEQLNEEIEIVSIAREVFVNHLQFKYQDLRELSDIDLFNNNSTKQICPSIEAFSDAKNKMKNRSESVPCWDHSRMKLANSAGSDYIHANWLSGYGSLKKFIATQGPLKETVDDFLTLLWQNDCGIVVVLTQLLEDNVVKCYPYWATDVNECRITDKFVVYTKKVMNRPHYVKYLLELRHSKAAKSRCLSLYHYTDWPENDTPKSIAHIIELIKTINKERVTKMNFNLACAPDPIVVHGSLGIGRTGTFCSIDLCFDYWLLEKQIDVEGVVRYVRKMRHSSVSNEKQYVFIWRVLAEIINKHVTYQF
uniref:protein-tyrosine-phosphatase n=1 Tax=Apophua simplicipes ichnovirus TaxID=1329648 RepID=S5DME8_9VIRU|nr:AsIV-cont00002-ORF2 [Apophua simplicipes ichnovirus]